MKLRLLPLLIAQSLPAASLASEATAPAALREVVVSATRIEQDSFEVPTTVTTIDAETLDQRQVNDLKDLMRHEAGVSVRSEPNRASAVFRNTGRAGNEGINIRGLEGDQVLLQVDGVRLPMIYTSGPFSAGRGDYIDPEAFKRVEILRGPSSTQYGSDGLAGAVSFLTKDPQDLLTLGKPFQISLKTRYASVDESWTLVPSAAYAGETIEALLLGSFKRGHETRNKGRNFSRNITRTAPNPEDYTSDALLGKLIVKPSRHHQFRFTGEKLDRHSDTEILSFFGDPFTSPTLTGVNVEQDITRRLVKLDYTYRDGDNRFFQVASASLYRQNTNNAQLGRETRSTNPMLRTRATNYAEDTLGANVQFESHLGSQMAHRIVYGLDASTTDVTSFKDGFNSAPPFFNPNKSFPDTDYRLYGAFVQGEFRYGALTVLPGLRYDRYTLDPRVDAFFLVNNTEPPSALKGSAVSPKLGAIWDIAPLASVYAQYARGFRAPKPSQVNGGVTMLSGIDPYISIGNPNLKPETSDVVELGVRGRDARLRYSAAVFHGRYKDFIETNVKVEDNPAPIPDIFKSINRGRVEISGLELRGQWQVSPVWGVSASYAHTRGDVLDNGMKTPLVTVDPDRLVAGVRYTPSARWNAELLMNAARGKTRNPDPATRVTPGGYAVFDLTGQYRINKNLGVSAGVFNLFDRKYFYWSDVRNVSPTFAALDAYSQPGRNFALSVKADF